MISGCSLMGVAYGDTARRTNVWWGNLIGRVSCGTHPPHMCPIQCQMDPGTTHTQDHHGNGYTCYTLNNYQLLNTYKSCDI